MLPKDESQHYAELRQAFLKHLPRRVESMRKRGHKLCRGVWDVNTVTLLFQDVQGLAGAAGRYGLLDASEGLFKIERALEPFVRELRMPLADERAALEQLLDDLARIAEPPSAKVRHPSDFVVALPDKASAAAIAAVLTPPEEYWRRYSHRDVAVMSSETHGQAPQPRTAQREWQLGDSDSPAGSGRDRDEPRLVNAGSVFALEAAHASADQAAQDAAAVRAQEPAPTRSFADELPDRAPAASRPRTGRVFFLADITAFARELSEQISGLGFLLDRLESTEELKEMLGSMAPDLIVIDSSYFDEIEHLGEFVKRVRQRVNGRLPLMAFSANNDLNARLKAMRAGVDAFLPLPIPAHEAALRVRELMDSESQDPYRVMIVEDDRSQALFAESVLRKAGIETLAVTEPLETLDKLERFRPDLILMDLYMPNISGMELTAIIRERDQFINTPIVFLSGEQDSEKHFEALSAGGDDFLAKPIRPKFLISAVNNRARRARQLARKRVLDPKDSTTGLFHRIYVIDRLNDLLAHEDRGAQPGGILFIEIEGAQALREQKGLAVYEPIMRQVGATIASLVRADELAARYGDSSFLVLSPDRSTESLQELAQHVVERLASELVEVEQHSVNVAASIGVAGFSQHMADAAQMLNAAERACARGRQDPGSSVHLHQAESLAPEGDGLVEAIRRALDNNGFQLLFQPIVSLHSTGEEQYEVLLRLRGDNGEIVGGLALVEAARGADLLAAVDRWCLSQCLRVVEDRRRQGRPVRLFVNQSVESTLDPERVPWLKQLLETRRVAPETVALEFKLGDVLARMREALAFFDAVRRIGVKVVVDDYDGSLTALQLLGVISADFLKLSDRFTRGNGSAEHSDELRTLVRAAHDGGKYVIAPKVETAQSAASLWTLGVDLIQGNFVQQPGAELGFDFSASAL